VTPLAPKLIIVDTGVFIALFSKKDTFHHKAVAWLLSVEGQSNVLICSTLPVVTELFHMLLKHSKHSASDNLENFSRFMLRINLKTLGHPDETDIIKDWLASSRGFDFADYHLVRTSDYFQCDQLLTIDNDLFEIRKECIKSSAVHSEILVLRRDLDV
jgi:predicted nucleic acid-binding protein